VSQLRKKVKELSGRVREGDVEAVQELFLHSVQMGHRRLAVRRLMLAQAMGAEVQEKDVHYCADILVTLPPGTAQKMADEAQRRATRYLGKGHLHAQAF
jgi:hypothetical protein